MAASSSLGGVEVDGRDRERDLDGVRVVAARVAPSRPWRRRRAAPRTSPTAASAKSRCASTRPESRSAAGVAPASCVSSSGPNAPRTSQSSSSLTRRSIATSPHTRLNASSATSPRRRSRLHRGHAAAHLLEGGRDHLDEAAGGFDERLAHPLRSVAPLIGQLDRQVGRRAHGPEPATWGRRRDRAVGPGAPRSYTPGVPLDPIAELGARAKAASRVLATTSTEVKDAALLAAADLLLDRHAEILSANADDVAAAEADGQAATVVDRLRLTDMRLLAMANGLRAVAALPDPVGEVADGWTRPNGLRVQRVRVPLGVVAIIYENRPNVTSDAFGLCLKAGNAAFLRGSSGAIRSNIAIASALREGLAKAGLPARLARAGGGHPPRGGGRVHAPPRVHRRADPAGRAVADPLGPRQRHRALRDRRRRQLPRVRRRRRRPRHGRHDRRERQDAAAVGVQRRRDAARPSQHRRHAPERGGPAARGRRAGRRRGHPGDPRRSCRRPSPPTTTTPPSSST